ncbi:hypothetical protein [Cupriavidus alkaliphilus]|uniref:hypothetical protein n=1 Tax=Cupriavidus alkaliphilus TaxID=942866 RepID=UPI00160BF711|nr:hypothetical protein [Cupriavidus alkaliphilus]MBB2915870.1 Flp pilus assembly protein TadG [Cupriavidus alkaliphilus]
MKDRDLVFPVIAVLVVAVLVLGIAVPVYAKLSAGMSAVAEAVSHAGEDRAGRVR